MTEGHGATAVQRLFRDEYSRTPPARSMVRLWRVDYQEPGTHKHRGAKGRLQISGQTKNRMRQLLDENPRIPVRVVAAQKCVAHTRIWIFYEKN